MSKDLFQPNQFLDFHTHRMRHEGQADVLEIVSLHPGKENTHHLFTIGHHPWWTDAPIGDSEQEQLRSRLKDPYCLALGEIGLDNLKGPAMPVQMEIMRSMLPLAIQTKKPVIIHCVRAYDQLIQIKKEFPEIQKWCVHGYGRHSTLAKQLIDQGFYLSLMPGLPTAKYHELLTSLPLDRIFLETDSMPKADIRTIYEERAADLSIEVSDLCRQMNENAQTFFTL